MASPFTCELSGESISEGVVVTPSGHICSKRLVLQKLAENGGKDPFFEDRPLVEDDLIELKTKAAIIPPPKSNGMASLLQTLQVEYDNLVLELFDTRKLLVETRQELSTALYQNDAAVRVIARIAAERDQARNALQNYSVTSSSGSTSKRTTSDVVENEEQQEPAQKKAKVDDASTSTMIPADDRNSMLEAWEKLHPTRKASQKKAAKEAPTLEDLSKYAPSVIKTTTKAAKGSTTALALSDNTSVVQILDKEFGMFGNTGGSWSRDNVYPFTGGGANRSVDMNDTLLVLGNADGAVQVRKVQQLADVVTFAQVSSSSSAADVVDVRLHPDQVHFVAATADGSVVVGRTDTVVVVGRFFESSKTYATGALHPDGLIYLAGDTSGKLSIWDFKSQSLAGSLDYDNETAVKCVEFSNNGYHVGAIYEDNSVAVWDLRKQSILKNLTVEMSEACSLQFDASGKYLAISGSRSSDGRMVVQVVTVKQWEDTVTLEASKGLQVKAGLLFGKSWIAASAFKKTAPQVVFFGI